MQNIGENWLKNQIKTKTEGKKPAHKTLMSFCPNLCKLAVFHCLCSGRL